MNWSSNLAAVHGLQPRGACLFWNPDLVTLNLVGNLGVALAAFAIAAQLLLAVSVGRAPERPLARWLLLLFGVLILLCGISRLFDMITLFRPLYWAQGIAVMLMALVALPTAALLPIDLIRSRQRGPDAGV